MAVPQQEENCNVTAGHLLVHVLPDSLPARCCAVCCRPHSNNVTVREGAGLPLSLVRHSQLETMLITTTYM
jgi:hypothetical protein